MPGLISYPPFPENVPTHPLLIVDYALLKAGDEDEIEKEHRDQDVDEGCPPPRAARKSRLETIVEDAE